MIENLFSVESNMIVLLLSLIFRFLRSAHDGLSQRAAFMRKSAHGYNLYSQVGAWPWHLINWAGRDLFIAVTYVYLFSNGVHGLVIAGAIVLNWLLHDFAYWLFCSRREQFQWGQGWPSFPSFFKHIFSSGGNSMPPNGLPIPTTTDEQAVLFVAVFESSTIIRVHDKRVNFTRRLTPEEVIANIRILSQNGKARVH